MLWPCRYQHWLQDLPCCKQQRADQGDHGVHSRFNTTEEAWLCLSTRHSVDERYVRQLLSSECLSGPLQNIRKFMTFSPLCSSTAILQQDVFPIFAISRNARLKAGWRANADDPDQLSAQTLVCRRSLQCGPNLVLAVENESMECWSESVEERSSIFWCPTMKEMRTSDVTARKWPP